MLHTKKKKKKTIFLTLIDVVNLYWFSSESVTYQFYIYY